MDLANQIKARQKALNKTPDVAQTKTLAPRDDMLNKIKGKKFILRRMTRSYVPKKMNKPGGEDGNDKPEPIPEEEDTSQLTVAAIYEKAKARRLAVEGSDSDEDDEGSFEDDDDSDW